jgi:hypothetical protein
MRRRLQRQEGRRHGRCCHQHEWNNKNLMVEIVAVLGKEAYDALSLEDHQMLDLFIWGSCCMHEDLNSFKVGNTEMMAEWKKLNAAAPVLLTNKAKTTVPQQTFILFNFFALTTL